MACLTSLLLAKCCSAGSVRLVYCAESQNSVAFQTVPVKRQQPTLNKAYSETKCCFSSLHGAHLRPFCLYLNVFLHRLSLATTAFSAAFHSCDPFFPFSSSFISQYFHFLSLPCLMPTFSPSIISSCPSVWGLVSLGL